ncbi:cyclin-like protein [Aulographum hederae CBS 113979]|uniref:RNA polymerase II holoenzyme cyclin-like subunit n=1 Tax=Aulographum hederae CBS 113979 TaxID=1176131 RepID=A0A6G1HHA2_9PEZI|nr:cyclin-like protein [Aulographum hederae CBS 113979]
MSDAVGPHPSFIEVRKPYIFEHQLRHAMDAIGMTEAKDTLLRLQGIDYINEVRLALNMPIRTFNTAAVYYHKFRLVHSDQEYGWADAALAALFTASKIEDTLKKSRDILCAAHNMKASPADQLSADDPIFEDRAKIIIGMERLMLEASGFDFTSRHPQDILVKFCKHARLPKDTVGNTAWNMAIDLYRTFAPLKQQRAVQALACLELSARLHDIDIDSIAPGPSCSFNYKTWAVDRQGIMETLLDLLDLYTHNRSATTVGPKHDLDAFITIRITMNQEVSANSLPRYTQAPPGDENASLAKAEKASPFTATVTNGIKRAANGHPKSKSSPFLSHVSNPATPASPSTPAPVGLRGQNSTVRFMFDPMRAGEEKEEVDRYFRVEEEEYEVEVEVERPVRVSGNGNGVRSGGGAEKEKERERERERER